MKNLSLLNDNTTIGMIKRIPILVRFLVFTVFISCFVMSLSISAQSIDNNKSMNFSVNNERLAMALEKLADEAGFNFAYNSADTIFNKVITYSAIRKTPIVIISELLEEYDLKYKVIDNQVIIFRDESIDDNFDDTTDSLVGNNKENDSIGVNEIDDDLSGGNIPINVTYQKRNNNVILVSDTIIIRDTVFKHETDTITVFDIVKMEVQDLSSGDSLINEPPFDYFRRDSLNKNGWSCELFVSPIIADFSMVKADKEFDVRNFSFGIELSKIFHNFSVTGSVKLTHFAEKFNHSYVVKEGGYFVVDTVDVYFTINLNDTTYYYVTDSSWKPLNKKEYNYNINNRVGLLDFGVSLSYDFFNSPNYKVYVMAGAQMDILIYKHGLAIYDPSDPSGTDFADLRFRTQSLSAIAGVGMKFKMNKSMALNSQVYYLHYFDDLVYDYPDNTQIIGLGVKLGIAYYF
jgi:hypothetical protein